jgi:hypothetical protein
LGGLWEIVFFRTDGARLLDRAGRGPRPPHGDMLAALLLAQERVLGPEHPETLDARSNLACWTGRAESGTRQA